MQGRFLNELDVPALRSAVARAEAEGVDAVFLTTGPLGDAISLSAALSVDAASVLLGIRTNLTTAPHRHPTVLARDMTALDLISRGRAVLSFAPPLGDEVGEAMALCRAMWRDGIAASDGPHYPVAGAINQPRPFQDGGPPLALDLTDGEPFDPALAAVADLLLVPAGSSPDAYPEGAELCQMESG